MPGENVMRNFLIAVLAGATVLAVPVAAGDDIVWPVYTLVAKSYDTRLTCPQLRAEIGNVEKDIRILTKARRQTEEAIRTMRETQTSMGRDQGGSFLNTGTSKASFEYIEARDQMKESKRIAELRRDHLNGLVPSCKDAPTSP
jgi:hypothetical protein